MAKKNRVKATPYDIRFLDGWRDGEGWTVNDSYVITTTKMWGINTAKNMRTLLRRRGLANKRIHLTADLSAEPMVTFEVRSTGEPVFAFIPTEE